MWWQRARSRSLLWWQTCLNLQARLFLPRVKIDLMQPPENRVVNVYVDRTRCVTRFGRVFLVNIASTIVNHSASRRLKHRRKKSTPRKRRDSENYRLN